jgi:serine protease Do
VIGNPLGHGNTVTAGIVSALDRNNEDSGFGSFFQIDAPLNQGNSGGPVFNAAGEVVGVATALFTAGDDSGSVGLGLAIPANDAELIVDRLLKHGEVQLGWIGAHLQPVTNDLAMAVGMPVATGSIVTELEAASPAGRAGVAPGDVILKVDDTDEIEPRMLNHDIAASRIGATIRLLVSRDGELLTIPVVVGESPADKPATKAPATVACEPVQIARRDLGLFLGPITADARDALGLASSGSGVLVTDVATNSVAADHGIGAGSVIMNVQRQSVTSPSQVQAAIDTARAEHRSFIMLLVKNTQGLRWLALPLDST